MKDADILAELAAELEHPGSSVGMRNAAETVAARLGVSKSRAYHLARKIRPADPL